ncbi:MAG: archaeal proteasome endopeptidase complex subunit beta [Nitrososphaerota archaeon]|nr:archaeal proteasome endopeptidase complex subunit beta [Nitrososphaerales archaeon]MDW8044804.1 archaeal proteasome endopeptidase complex subunit beta [Nitrososphaerota archaeon]
MLNFAKHRGTTTVGLVCSDGVVFATDTRVTLGYLFIAHKKGKKIYKIDDHLGMTIAGSLADAQNIVDTLRYYTSLYKLERKAPIPIRSAARLTANVFFSSRLFPYIADVLVGGVDASGGSVFNIDLFGSLTEEKFVSTGSGSPVAYGILESEYREGISTSDGILLAVKAIIAAMRRNAGTGDDIDVAVISKDGFRELSPDEKNRIITQIIGRS